MSGVDTATRVAGRYLALADRLLPSRIVGFYLVGSTVLGAYREGRSDIDFVAVVDRPLSRRELRRVRMAQLVSAFGTTAQALAHGHVALPGTVNGAYIASDDVSRPVTTIRPVASHVGGAFRAGAAFDVNPVVWKELHEHGIALRGPDPSALNLSPEPEKLRRWNLDNLNGYWRGWAEASARGRAPMSPLLPTGWLVGWGALGAPRLHHTIRTGDVISKEAAGEYALEVFERKWHPPIEDALAFLRREPPASTAPRRSQRIARAADFVTEVVRSANALQS